MAKFRSNRNTSAFDFPVSQTTATDFWSPLSPFALLQRGKLVISLVFENSVPVSFPEPPHTVLDSLLNLLLLEMGRMTLFFLHTEWKNEMEMVVQREWDPKGCSGKLRQLHEQVAWLQLFGLESQNLTTLRMGR